MAGRIRWGTRWIPLITAGSVVAALLLVGASPALAESEVGIPTQASCDGVSGTNTIPVPPPGKVTRLTLWLDASCEVHMSVPVTMDAVDVIPTLGDPSVLLQSVSGVTATDGVPLTVYNGAAYAIERTRDPVGINLNELFSNLTWTGDGSRILSYHGWDGAIYHREGGGITGWSLNPSDSYLRVVAGGVGATAVKTEAHQGFSYQGVFDPTGTYYYNSYTEDLTGFVYGAWLCSYSYYWRHGFTGWKLEQYCGAGTTSG